MFRLMLESGNVKANVGVRLHYCQCWVQFMLRLMLGSAYVKANVNSGYVKANCGVRLCSG